MLGIKMRIYRSRPCAFVMIESPAWHRKPVSTTPCPLSTADRKGCRSNQKEQEIPRTGSACIFWHSSNRRGPAASWTAARDCIPVRTLGHPAAGLLWQGRLPESTLRLPVKCHALALPKLPLNLPIDPTFIAVLRGTTTTGQHAVR